MLGGSIQSLMVLRNGLTQTGNLKKKKLGYRLLYNPHAYLYHLLGKGGHFNERFEGFGRIKNFLRFHWRHGRWRFLNIKFYVYVLVWLGYFIGKRFKWLK